MSFKPNHIFHQEYDRLYRLDPLTANVFLLLCELADDKGEVQTSDDEICRLLAERYSDPWSYQL